MSDTEPTTEKAWSLQPGVGPLVATAIHDGHELRDDVAEIMALPEEARLREEDPFTGEWTAVAPTRVIATRSRFEVDLNRPRASSVYRLPEDAWGLEVWTRDLPDDLVRDSLSIYDRFYDAMRELLAGVHREHGVFLVYDLHSYNHRREGPEGPSADESGNPQVNIGTGTMDRERWGPVVDEFIAALRAFDFPGGALDVRENVKFRGGNWSRWVHETFPEGGVALAIEFKKFFMDEWSGEPDRALVDAIGDALRSTVKPVLAQLART
jgi:N-formylglutamate amidohydrolase